MLRLSSSVFKPTPRYNTPPATAYLRITTRVLSAKMSQWKPNTDPPKTVAVFRNIAQVASESDKFRRVLWTGRNSQLVIMTIPVGGEIGEVSVCTFRAGICSHRRIVGEAHRRPAP